jgi:hypothetical protein
MLYNLERDTARELQHHVQAPDALVGMAVIAAMTFACQGKVDVRLPTGKVSPVTMFMLAIASSGERKSTIDRLVMAPFRDEDRRRTIENLQRIKEYQAEHVVWEARNRGLTQAIAKTIRKREDASALNKELFAHASVKPEVPRLKLLMHEDVTPAALMEALEGDGVSIAISTDEGQILFQGAAMDNLGLLNRVWDGPPSLPKSRFRANGDIVSNPRASMWVMAQPEALAQYRARKEAITKGSGHWARYLVGWPGSTQGNRWTIRGEPRWEQLAAFHERVRSILESKPASIAGSGDERTVLEFTPEAADAWYGHAEYVEQLLRSGEFFEDISDFASKLMEIIGRLAAILHHFSGQSGAISCDSLGRASQIFEWHVYEFKRLFTPRPGVPQCFEDAEKVLSYLYRKQWNGGTVDLAVRQNQVLHVGPVRPVSRLEAALKVLFDRGAIYGAYDSNGATLVVLRAQFFMKS